MILRKVLNERLRIEGKSDPLFFQNQNKHWQRLEYHITLPISDSGNTVKERQREGLVTDFWDTIYPQKAPSVICATIGRKTGFFSMAITMYRIPERNFSLKCASAEYFHSRFQIGAFFLINYLIINILGRHNHQ